MHTRFPNRLRPPTIRLNDVVFRPICSNIILHFTILHTILHDTIDIYVAHTHEFIVLSLKNCSLGKCVCVCVFENTFLYTYYYFEVNKCIILKKIDQTYQIKKIIITLITYKKKMMVLICKKIRLYQHFLQCIKNLNIYIYIWKYSV